MERLCIFDLETTGISPNAGHRAIEIGVIEVIDRKITEQSFHVYLNPGRSIDTRAQQIHGISEEFLADKPRFEDIVDNFLAFIKGSTMIAHNASFDESFLTMELGRLSLPPLEQHCQSIVDSLPLARKLYPGKKNSLDALCARLEVSNTHRKYHGALLDSELLAKVYLKMTGGQESLCFESFESKQKTPMGHSNEQTTHTCAVKITSEQREAHDNWIKMMNKDNSQCLFSEC